MDLWFHVLITVHVTWRAQVGGWDCTFSLTRFEWRRLNIGQFESRDNLPESTVRGGVFHYRQVSASPPPSPLHIVETIYYNMVSNGNVGEQDLLF